MTQRNTSGFTLVEMLMALAILAIGMVSVVQLFPQSILQMRKAAELTVTSETAATVAGEIQGMGAEALFDDEVPKSLLRVFRESDLLQDLVDDGLAPVDIDAEMDELRALEQVEGFYGYNTSIQRLNSDDDVFLQRVTIAVTLGGGNRQTYTTYVAYK